VARCVRIPGALSAAPTGASTTLAIFSTPAHQRMSVQHQSTGRPPDTTQPYPTECLNCRSSVGSRHEADSLAHLQPSGSCPKIERHVRHEHVRAPALSGLTNRLAASVPTQRTRAPAWSASDSGCLELRRPPANKLLMWAIAVPTVGCYRQPHRSRVEIGLRSIASEITVAAVPVGHVEIPTDTRRRGRKPEPRQPAKP
jgi:hypothetical protein